MSMCTILSDVAFPYNILIFRHVPFIDKHKPFTKRLKGLKTWVRKMQTEKGRHSNKILRGAPTYCSDKLQLKGKKHLSSLLIISEGNQRALVDEGKPCCTELQPINVAEWQTSHLFAICEILHQGRLTNEWNHYITVDGELGNAGIRLPCPELTEQSLCH